MLGPFVEPVTTFNYSGKNLDRYIGRQHEKQNALPAAEVDRLLIEQEAALLQTITPATVPAETSVKEHSGALIPLPEQTHEPRTPIWDRTGKSGIWTSSTPSSSNKPKKPQRKRGPKPDVENHQRVATIIRRNEDNWILDDNLIEIREALDQRHVPIPKPWPSRADGKSHTWSRAFQNYPTLVIKAIKDRCKAAEAAAK